MAAGRPLERSIGTLMTIAENIARIRANMAAAAREAGRDPKEILLVGASKMNNAAPNNPTQINKYPANSSVTELGETRIYRLNTCHSTSTTKKAIKKINDSSNPLSIIFLMGILYLIN